MNHCLPLTTLFLLTTPVVASAQLATYDAGTAGNPAIAPDPTTLGWTLQYPAGTGVTLTDISPDGTTGLNAWQVDDQGTSGNERAHYEMMFTPQENADAATFGWEYEVTMRVLHANGLDLIFEYANGNTSSDDRYSIFYTVSGNDVIAEMWLTGGTYTCVNALDGNYHSFMYRKPPGQLDAEFYYDGQLMGPLPRANSHVYGPDGGVTWGAGSSGATAGANFNFVQFRILSQGPGTPYCFGRTDQGNPCPCGNDNDGSDPNGAGCAHDDSAAGAALSASGVASVSADTLLLEGSRGPISNSSLFFQANNNLDGSGSFLGDGIRCAGGGLIRLKVKMTDATGYADSSPAVITTRSASFGHTIVAGETLHYQWWFRDVGGSPCGNESNTSNGYTITWAP